MDITRIVKLPQDVMPPSRHISPGLAKLLMRNELITIQQLEHLATEAGHRKILTYLCERAGLDGYRVLSDVADLLSVSLVDLSESTVLDGARCLQLPTEFSREFALRLRCFPFNLTENSLKVAMVDPLDHEVAAQLEFMFQVHVDIVMASESQLVEAINVLFGVAYDVQVLKPSTGSFGKDHDDLEKASKTAPVVKFVNKILADALRQQASDIHFEPTGKGLSVRFRKDGIMTFHVSVPERLQPYIVTRIKILSDMDISEKRRPQDGSFSLSTGTGLTCDVRVSSVPTPEGEKLVLRVLQSGIEEARFEVLGMESDTFERMKEVLQQPDRILVVTGPTGSGKTTTLYASLRYLRDGTKNIVTVEDPIEYRLDGITQIQLDKKIGVTFASGLRSILRQDPDIIFVGEVRDLETAEVAFQASQTGHLVLTTLHANSAPAVIVRLIDLGIEPYIIAESLGGVLAQRLVRKLCSSCARLLNDDEVAEFERITQGDSRKVKYPVGCSRCSQTGYMGRVGVYSFLSMTAVIRDLIRERAGESLIEAESEKIGFDNLWMAGLKLVTRGITSLDELLRVVGRLQRPKSISGDTVPKTVKSDDRRADSGLSILHMTQSVDEEDRSSNKVKRILLIDDDMHVRKIMNRELRKYEFQILEADDGTSGIEAVRREKPDLILCDFMMPGCDGKEVVQTLKADDSVSDIPIIILTSLSDEAHEIDLIKSGADDFIGKSSSPKVVATRVRRFFR